MKFRSDLNFSYASQMARVIAMISLIDLDISRMIVSLCRTLDNLDVVISRAFLSVVVEPRNVIFVPNSLSLL